MEERFQSLATKVFKKDLTEITTEEVASLAHQYPYFAPLQFIRLSQLAPGTEEYQQQYQKSILYYPDPLAFDHFLHKGQDLQFEGEDDIPFPEDEKSFEEEEDAAGVIESEELTGVREVEPAEGVVTVPFTEEVLVDPVEVEPVDEPMVRQEEAIEPRSNEPNEVPPNVDVRFEDEGGAKDREPSLPNINISQPELTAADLTFEPYHTVDYFASQGIKVTAETVSQDKFGKQVKSFTDWLKTMKRLPLAELGKNLTPITEKKVENLAEHSVQDADVVTESMAQVWEKQGNIAKATEVYHKLSLQNPSKRAYFAAKIDKLTEEF